MKKVFAVFVILVLSISILAGCGGSDEEAPKPEESKEAASAETKEEAPIEEAPSEEAPGEEDSAENFVTILNSTSYTFNELYISSVDDDDWGDDLLGSTVIAGSESYDVDLLGSDSDEYDIKVVDSEDDDYVFSGVLLENECEIEIAWDSGEVGASVTYSDGSATYITGELKASENSSSRPGVTFYNKTDWAFDEIFVYEAGSPDMGSDLTNDSSLFVDESVDLKIDTFSSYDIEFVDEEGDSWEFEDVSLEDGCSVEVARQPDVQITVTNAGGDTEVYSGTIN